MKKNILFISLIVAIGFIGINNVNADSTVLYNDGTLIINEKESSRETNISKYGSVKKEYAPLSEENNYVFTSADDVIWKNERNSIKQIYIGQKINPTSTAYWFNGTRSLLYANMGNLNTSNVTSMKSMFASAGYDIITTVTIEGLFDWNTSKVIDMSSMFQDAGANASDLHIAVDEFLNWDTSSVTDMSYMFFGVAGNDNDFDIDISAWDTSSVTNMRGMFEYAVNSANKWFFGDLSNWDVSNVTNMRSMFQEMSVNSSAKFNIGDLSNWDTSKVTTMEEMFENTAPNSSDFNSIGVLTVPKNCESYMIVANAKSLVGGLKFESEVSKILPEEYGLFANTATKANARLNLYFTDRVGAIKDNIALYGPQGTYSHGNIYAYFKIYIDNITKGTAKVLINGEETSDFYAEAGDLIKVLYEPQSGYYLQSLVVRASGAADLIITKANTEFQMPSDSIKIYDKANALPVAPKTLTLKLSSYNGVSLAWSKVTNASGYYVYYRTPGKQFTLMGATTKLSVTKTKLLAGKNYAFAIMPYVIVDGKKVTSGSYISKNIYTLKKMTKPTLWHYSSTKIKMRWTKIDGASGYQIAKSSTKAGTYTIIRTTKPTSSSYKISQSTKQYWYKIRAFKTVNGKKVYAPWSDPTKKINTAE